MDTLTLIDISPWVLAVVVPLLALVVSLIGLGE